jgi:hypothetical protein
MKYNVGARCTIWILGHEIKIQIATTRLNKGPSSSTIATITITSRGAYSRIDSKKNAYSQEKVHKENKSTSNGCKFVWEESVYSSR